MLCNNFYGGQCLKCLYLCINKYCTTSMEAWKSHTMPLWHTWMVWSMLLDPTNYWSEYLGFIGVNQNRVYTSKKLRKKYEILIWFDNLCDPYGYRV